jgi:hypothetical protein
MVDQAVYKLVVKHGAGEPIMLDDAKLLHGFTAWVDT